MAKAKNKPNKAVWMATGSALVGVAEVPGTRSNPKIMQWATKLGRMLGVRYDGDHVPWCGLFVAYVMNENGYLPPSVPVRASAWATWGQALTNPSYGAVLVFTRNGGGHVGFYVSEDKDYYHVLGGNQSDKVCVTKIAKSRCTAIRWPPGTDLPTAGPVLAAFTGKVSTNEA